jgi:uncharacterized membrane protein
MRWQDGPLYLHDGVGRGWPMIVLMAILTAAVVVAVVFLVRYLVRVTPAARVAAVAAGAQAAASYPSSEAATFPLAPAASPQDLLRRRYAAGEIDREEYLQKLQDLQGPMA